MKITLLTLFICLLTSISFADSIFIEGFEYANHDGDIPIGWTCNDQSWVCGYLEKDHNRIPHSGNWYAYTNAEESWMFMPLYFSSQLKYRLSCWAISDGEYELEFWMGNEAEPSQMTHQLSTFDILGAEYDKFSIYLETLSSNYEYFGIHAIAHEGAYCLTIDDVIVDMVAKYEFIATPSSADTVLFPGSQATYHFNVQNLGYTPIQVIFSPSHEYFTNFHFYVEGNSCSSFHLDPNETKEVTAEATLLSSIPIGSICWLDIMLLLDCDCATGMTTLWVTVIDPSNTDEHQTDIKFYPNPVTNHLNIHADGLQHVEMMDLTGRKILTTSTTQDDLQLDMTSFKPGIYLITTFSEQGFFTQKIAKQ